MFIAEAKDANDLADSSAASFLVLSVATPAANDWPSKSSSERTVLSVTCVASRRDSINLFAEMILANRFTFRTAQTVGPNSIRMQDQHQLQSRLQFDLTARCLLADQAHCLPQRN